MAIRSWCWASSMPDRGRLEIDATGLAVAPGFINMLSWAGESLIQDPRSLSDLVQGVTLEVMGEGRSMGPLTADSKADLRQRQGDIQYEVEWTTLAEYLRFLEDCGVATNVASFVGATTDLVRRAMAEGALGVGSSLPYTPAAFASTDELIALARAAAESGGMYISHIRDEGGGIFEALDEFLTIVRESGVRGEVYHLKSALRENWDKLDGAIAKLEEARAEGLAVTADIYPYHASSTGLTYVLPTWAKEGSHDDMIGRLLDPQLRPRLLAEIDLIPPEDILLVSFRQPEMRQYTGKTLAEVAEQWQPGGDGAVLDDRAQHPQEAGGAVDQLLLRRRLDSARGARSPTPSLIHGPTARLLGLLGKYVREEGILSLAEAIHRLSGLPADNLRLDRRGQLAEGYYADVVIFDPATVIDRATFEEPHQLATGVVHVFVNGEQVLRDGEHTGALPGRFVKGPGWQGGRQLRTDPAASARPIAVSWWTHPCQVEWTPATGQHSHRRP
nr:D-aminoacylase-like [Nerophis lumbriciformis]